ncbi:hypothetical protein ONZ43_g7220 [Nemania bipapillata]|uniref:Uncharacterized protein n=1 Tax=Nemania bipapillata TaxID=110536 RepID=A0ACC2HSJ3_9PEZI|nr:hypothetical protein ONZ43_g7220 [Nemania bipapillata]
MFSVAGLHYVAGERTSTMSVPSLRNVGLFTVFSVPQMKCSELSAEWIRSSVQNYLENDDVFTTPFLKTVVFHGVDEGSITITPEALDYLAQQGNERRIFITGESLLPGPYVSWGREIRDVWRLVDDSSGTCMLTLKPQQTVGDDPFEIFSSRIPGSQFRGFAIPSRIKTSRVSDSPLSGFRVVIKDNIHLKGIRTSAGNKGFHDTYRERTESAPCVKRLIDHGVVLLGKTKMNSFGNWEEPVESTDYQAPWNPRGDGYQSPGGSSSGSAAAIASYDWLDIAIGTDTWASVTRPSLWCGCFGLRPTQGALSADGIEPFCQLWDTAGVLARDLQKCRDFSSVWLSPGKLRDEAMPFSSIIWPTDYWSIIDSKQITIAKGFVEKIKVSLALECEDLSFKAMWEQLPPSEAVGVSLDDYINEAPNAQCYDAYHNLDEFRAKHHELFGHAPYVSPPNQKMWSFAETMSQEKRDQDFAKIDVYKQWFTQTVWAGTRSNALIVMPLESMSPRYRDEVPSFKRPPQDGIGALTLGPVMDSPVLAVPVAEIPYHSRITDRDEALPFVLAIMGPKGSDLALMDAMLKVLEKSDMPTVVKTGRSMF